MAVIHGSPLHRGGLLLYFSSKGQPEDSLQGELTFRIWQGSAILTQWRPTDWAALKKPRTEMPQMPMFSGGVGQHSRGEGIQATGFHLQQAVPPVFLGHPEIVHGAPEDPESGVLQHEILAIGL